MARVTSVLLFVSFLLSTAFSLKKFFVSSNVKCIDVSRTKLRAIWDLNLQRLGKGSRWETRIWEVTKSWKYQVLTFDHLQYSQKSSRWRLWSACAPNIRWRNCLKGSEKNFSKRTWRWRKVFHSLKVRKICDDTRNPLPRYTIRYVKESNWYISIILLPTGPAHQATVHFPKTIWIHCLDSLNTINS